MLLTHVMCAIGAVTTVQALPNNARSTYAVKERHIVPRGWTRVGDASKSDSIHLAIGLKQQNEGVVEQHLLEVSDPSHSRYGQHLTSAEVEDIIRPSEETQDQVKNWLDSHGITGFHNAAKDFIHIVISIEQAEKLLQTSYSSYQHRDGSVISRTPEWSLPRHLHEHIDMIQPTTSFFRPRAEAFNPQLDDFEESLSWWEDEGKELYGSPSSGQGQRLSGNGVATGAGPISEICNITFTTPDCVRTLYGTYDYKPRATEKNGIGHTNYLNETSYRADIRKYLELLRPEAAKAADEFEMIIIANANNDQGPYSPHDIKYSKNIEANLDSDHILSIAWPTPMTVWATGGSPPFTPDLHTKKNTNEPYLVWLDHVLSQKKIPQVISTSYGDDEITIPESYMNRVCAGYAQLGARGVSVFFSSGDSGVGQDAQCVSNDGKNTTMFIPTFPASCPWVTTVGATKWFEPEVAVTRFASGAGFSNQFPQPKYQSNAVNAYVESLNGLHDGLYNKSGRAYPDVAAQGNHAALVLNHKVRTVGGTSVSSPIFAAVISLVNDALLAEGKPVLGFLNPWIYSGAYKTLTDITSGASYGCGTDGFPAKTGWDAVTGFGTPNFRKLVDAAFERYGGHPGDLGSKK